MDRRGSFSRAGGLLAALLLTACTGAGPDEDSAAGTVSPSVGGASPDGSGSTLAARAAAVREVAELNVEAGIVAGLTVVLADDTGTRTIAMGDADLKREEPMTDDGLFRITSITNAIVASVILQLVDQGALRLEDTVERWQPGLLEHGGEINLADLLGHVSGLPDPDLGKFVGKSGVTERDLVAPIASLPLDFRPGEELTYRDINYVILGLVIESLTGRPLEDVVQRRLFDPLGMSSSRFVQEGVVPAGMVHGYEAGEDLTDLDIYWAKGSVGIAAPGRDVSRFFEGLFDGRVLSEEQFAAMTDVRDGNIGLWTGYGLGIAQTQIDCGQAFGHGGRFPGYAAEAWTDPETSRSVVVLANTSSRAVNGTLDATIEAALCG